MFNHSMADLDMTPFVSLAAYEHPGYFKRVFRSFLDLGGQVCPVGPMGPNKPKAEAARREKRHV